MKKEYLFGVIGLLVGVLVTFVFVSTTMNSNESFPKGMNTPQKAMMNDEKDAKKTNNYSNGMEMSMDEMMNELEGKSGDEFDKTFLLEMINHHQGAIEMAKGAKQYAKHDQLKEMADTIISAQSTEILQMQQWQKEWGYN